MAFAAVSALSTSYRARQRRVTASLSERARLEMNSGNIRGAILAYRAALDLSPGAFSNQLGLAEALIADKRNQEALAYLQVLWDQQPENGKVNLELARTYVGLKDNDQAIRHYQNAIYAVWDTDTDGNRRAVRIELVQYLLNHGAIAQADGELVALAGNLPEEPTLRNQVAALFVLAGDYSRAVAQYQRVLSVDPKNKDALTGAGRAAFLAGRYASAERYLKEVVAPNSTEPDLVNMLSTAKLVLDVDPLDTRISDSERRSRTQDAFQTAVRRLNNCLNQHHQMSSELQNAVHELRERQNTVQAKLNDSSLLQNQDLSNTTLEFAFAIEKTTEPFCGPPSGKDLALFLMSKGRGEVER